MYPWIITSLCRRPYARLTEAIKKAACVETQAVNLKHPGARLNQWIDFTKTR